MGWLSAIGSALSALAKFIGPVLGFMLGKSRTKARQAKKAAKQAREGHEIDEDVRRLSDDDLDDELRGG